MISIARELSSLVTTPLPPSTPQTAILVTMLTLAIYMSFLINLKAITTFERRSTLYFWSLLVTSWGIVSHSLGVIFKFFVASAPWWVFTAFSSFGWWAMITGQSLVLYSRLHLVVRDPRLLRAVLWMIIVDFCIFQVPTTVQKFGTNETNSVTWLMIYHIYERIQLIVFTLQELIISVIYIRATVRLLSPSDPDGTRRTKWFLIYLNVLCIAFDIIIVCEVFTGEWGYEEATQSLVYAVKLTLEFVVLNKLVEVYRLGPRTCTTCHGRHSSNTLNSLSRYGDQTSTAVASNRRGGQHDTFKLETMSADVDTKRETNGKSIIVTTGITTWREDRDSYHGSRLADAVTP